MAVPCSSSRLMDDETLLNCPNNFQSLYASRIRMISGMQMVGAVTHTHPRKLCIAVGRCPWARCAAASDSASRGASCRLAVRLSDEQNPAELGTRICASGDPRAIVSNLLACYAGRAASSAAAILLPCALQKTLSARRVSTGS